MYSFNVTLFQSAVHNKISNNNNIDINVVPYTDNMCECCQCIFNNDRRIDKNTYVYVFVYVNCFSVGLRVCLSLQSHFDMMFICTNTTMTHGILWSFNKLGHKCS